MPLPVNSDVATPAPDDAPFPPAPPPITLSDTPTGAPTMPRPALRLTRPTALALILAAGAAALAPASQALAATELKYDLPEGTKFKFSQRDAMDLDLTMVMAGQQMNTQMVVDNTVSGEQTVLAAQGGIPTKVKIAFDPGLATKMTMMGQDQTTPFALAGKTVTVTRPVGGEATVDAGGAEVDDAVRKAVGDLVDYDPATLPGKPIEVGDSWKPEVPMAAGEGQKGDMTLTLVRLSDRAGRRVAELRADAEVSGDVQGMKMSGTRTGPIVVDLATGLVVDSKLDGDMTLSGTQEQEGMKITFDGTGTGTSAATGQILEGGSPAAATSASAAATPRPRGDPDSHPDLRRPRRRNGPVPRQLRRRRPDRHRAAEQRAGDDQGPPDHDGPRDDRERRRPVRLLHPRGRQLRLHRHQDPRRHDPDHRRQDVHPAKGRQQPAGRVTANAQRCPDPVSRERSERFGPATPAGPKRSLRSRLTRPCLRTGTIRGVAPTEADQCKTPRRPRSGDAALRRERVIGFEPTTFSLGS